MTTRPYTMTGRAAEAERSGERIQDAMVQRFAAQQFAQIRLEDVAADAEVTVQTVLRRFGSKSALLVTVVERELGVIAASRAAIAGATPRETVVALVEHYEKYGALIQKAYSEASQVDGLDDVVRRGREYHVAWSLGAFAPALNPAAARADQERRDAQLVAICDARTWHILRIECGLSIEQTADAIYGMLAPLLAAER